MLFGILENQSICLIRIMLNIIFYYNPKILILCVPCIIGLADENVHRSVSSCCETFKLVSITRSNRNRGDTSAILCILCLLFVTHFANNIDFPYCFHIMGYFVQFYDIPQIKSISVPCYNSTKSVQFSCGQVL